MSRPRQTDTIRERKRATSRRQHYHQYLVKAGEPLDDGRVLPYDYNPVLDDPDDPRNYRHWSHGDREGYRQAGCKCPPDNCTCPAGEECTCTDSCAAAGSRAARAEAAKRMDNRLAAHRATATVFLDHALGVGGSAAANGAEAVVSTAHVVSKFRAKVDYHPVAVRLALRDWGAPALMKLDDDALNAIVDQLIEELQK